jgi:hypothetical protein
VDSRPSIDDCFDRLRQAGWRLDEKASGGGWQVRGTHDGITIQAEGVTRSTAWQQAWEQAQARDRRRPPVAPPPLWATLLFYAILTLLLFGVPYLLVFAWIDLFRH